MRVILILAFAVGAAVLPAPSDLGCIFALAAWHLVALWAHKNALRRVAQGVQARLDSELMEAIDAARRAPASTD
jgi:hypothetical protein